jgi:hypothetical protein
MTKGGEWAGLNCPSASPQSTRSFSLIHTSKATSALSSQESNQLRIHHTSPENLARDKRVRTWHAQFDPAQAWPGTVGNRLGLARSTSRVVLGPDWQPIGQARHKPFSLAWW